MGMGQFLNYSGDNEPEPEEEKPRRSIGDDSREPKWWELGLGCLVTLTIVGGIIGGIIWLISRL